MFLAFPLFGALVVMLTTSLGVSAQVLPAPGDNLSLEGELLWAEPVEVLAFTLDMVLALALAASLAWHPKRMRDRQTVEDLSKPFLILLYGLIGMAVGFLVVHHGYIIGFVVFGMGALLRFRNSMDKNEDTVQVMFVTLLGLTVGLGLSFSAVLLTIVGWGLIWFSGQSKGYEIVLKGNDDAALSTAIEAVEEVLSKYHVALINRTSNPTKLSARILVKAPAKLPQTEFEGAVLNALPQEVQARVES